MKANSIIKAVALSALIPAVSTGTIIVQFGGDAAHTSDADWISQIGGDQIIQWNGVNSDGGSFGSSGTMVNQGIYDAGPPESGGKLTSLGTENLILTTTGISATNTTSGFPTTGAAGAPNVLGVQANDTGDDAAKFNIGNTESWTFQFNKDVTLLYMVGAAMDFDLERFGIDIGDDGTNEYEWNRSAGFTVGSGSVAAVTYDPVANRYVAMPTGGIAIAANTDVTISVEQGNIGLQALVVEVVPEPSTFALLAGLGVLGLVVVRRKQASR